MSGYFAKTFFRGLRPQGVHRRARNPGDHHDIALALESLGEPLCGDAAGLFLIDRDIVGARLRDLAVVGDDHDALVAGILDGAVERGRGDRVDDDRFGALLDHRIELLDLSLRVRPGDLDL